MLDNLIVKNYRNLSDLRIEKLARVNLITGKNNTGKTALLEAISIYISLLDLSEDEAEIYQLLNNALYGHLFEWIIYLLQSRGADIMRDSAKNYIKNNQFNSNAVAFKSIFNYADMDAKDPIILGCEHNGNNDLIYLSFLQELTSIPSQLGFRFKKNKLQQSFFLGEFLPETYGYPSNLNFKYIGSSTIRSDNNSDLWDNIQLYPAENSVINALQIIDPNIEALIFYRNSTSNNLRDPYVKLNNPSIVIPLRSMGDGINRILTIILTLANANRDKNAKGGYVLIDEFENGLHYTVQEKLWEVIFKTAKELNVQVFATTHSEDCVKAFAKVQSSFEGEGQYIRLQNKKGIIVSVPYDAHELITATEHHIETR
jgi:AAA15 family ATPase/GTPase